MALTKTPIELSSTPSIVDGGNATAITIDSSEDVTLANNLEITSTLKVSGGTLGFGTTAKTDSHSGWNQFYIGQKGSVLSENATGTHGLDGLWLTDNLYVDSDTGSFANIETNESSAIKLEAGQLHFYSQASGSAGAGVTLSEKFNINSSGVVTANAGVVVDEMTIDGDTLTATDEFIVDAASHIKLDADSGNIIFRDAGTNFSKIINSSGDVLFSSETQDKDIKFNGNDGGASITALVLDMSDAGAATFNNTIAAKTARFTPATGETVVISRDTAGPYLGAETNHNLRIISNNTTRITLNNSANTSYTADGIFGGSATPNKITSTGTGDFYLGYKDNGSGLYSAAIGLGYDAIDGLNNTVYVDGFVMRDTGNGTTHLTIETDGDIRNTNGTFTSLSDERIKSDIADASSQWNDIKAVKVRKFKLATQPTPYKDKFHIGVIAQELEAAGMNGLIKESDPDTSHLEYDSSLVGEKIKSVKYSILHMKALKALQEAMIKIEALEARVTTLEG